MNPAGSLAQGHVSEELSALIETLHKTQKQLEELTGGEVDTVADREGRALLLGRAQEQLRHIEEAKQAASLNAMRESERRFSDMLDNVDLVSVMLDRDARILYCNDYLLRLTGWHQEEVIGRSWVERFIPPESGGLNDRLAALLTDRPEARHGENTIVTRSGERLRIRWNNSLLRSPAGEVIGTASIGEDITEQKRAEEELQRISTAIDATADAIYLVDRSSMRFVHFNEAACRMRGQTRSEILALGPAGLLSVSRAELERTYDAIIASGKDAEPLEMLRTRDNGAQVWLELRRHAQRTGDRWTIVTLVRDITERKQAAQDLRESEARFRSLTLLSSDWFWEQDAEHRFIAFSGGEGVEGWGPDQNKAVGLHRWDLGGVVPISCTWEEHKGTLDAHKPFRKFEYRRILGDGRLQFVEASGEPMFDAGGKFAGYRGVAAEITERKTAEIKIKRLNRVHAVLSGINTLIVRVRDRDELLREACRLVVEVGAFKMAWIGVMDQQTLDGKVVAWHGGEKSFLDMVSLTAREGMPSSDWPGSRALRLLQPSICNDIATDPSVRTIRDALLKRGHASAGCFPLTVAGRREGVLCLFAGEPHMFDDEETRLLAELSGNISLALEHIEKAGKLAHTTRVNAMLSGINSAIVRIRTRDALFREACRIAVAEGRFVLARVVEVDSVGRASIAATTESDAHVFQGIVDEYNKNPALSTSLLAVALRSGQPTISNDVAGDPRIPNRKALTKAGNYALALLPITVEQHVVGTVILRSRVADLFDAAEKQLLLEMVSNVSFALEHIEKETKVRRLTRVYAVLSGINSLIVRVRDREELFASACRIAVEHGKFVMAWIGIVDRTAMELRPVASAGTTNDYRKLVNQRFSLLEDAPRGNFLGRQAIRGKTSIFSNDVQSDPKVVFKDEHAARGSRSMVVLPLEVGGEVVGLLTLYAEEADFFDDEEIRLLTELAGDIAFAVDNIDRAGKLDRVTRVNAMLSGINGAIVRIRGRQELCEEACRIAVETGALPFAWLGMVDAFETHLQLVASAGRDDGFLQTIRDRLAQRGETPESQSLSWRAIRERRAVVVNDVAADTVLRSRKAFADRGISAVAVFPLFIADRVAGAFALHSEQAGFFDDDELRLLDEVAANIAFALEHIEKEEKVRRLTRVYAVLSGINTLIVRTRDRDELFREACRIAVEVGQFSKAWLGTVDPASKQFTMVAAHGGDPLFFRSLEKEVAGKVQEGRGLVVRAIETGQPVIVNDAAGDPDVLLKDDASAGTVRSLAILPVAVSGEVVAVFALNADVVDYFDDEEMKLLVELAGDIGFALDHIGKEAKLDYLAYYDALTGLANRTLFLERVAQHMRGAVAGGHKLALFFLDLERFRNINDSLGRPAGDALLKQVSEWLVLNLGDRNLLARLGGDHFGIVLPEVAQDGDVARLLDQRTRAFADHPFRFNDTEIRLATRVGVAVSPNDGTDAETLLRNAETALKKAKAGGERWLFYQQKMTEALAGKLTLENQLRRALDNEEFVLHYQPKVSLEDGKLTGAEALIRWNDPLTGLVPPDRFIPILEETGLIYEVGRWALRQAIEDYLRWRNAGLPVVRIAVNVSPLQLRKLGFIDEIGQHIGINSQAAAGLELEITESLIMEDVKHSIATLTAIRAMGISIAIDDFGTGFSSLSYLARLPVDTLKIDRSFVIDMTAGPQGLALVSTIINLAHSLKLKVVAEGVETEEQSRLLRLLRCNEMQGFLFSKPVPAGIFEAKFLAPPGAG